MGGELLPVIMLPIYIVLFMADTGTALQMSSLTPHSQSGRGWGGTQDPGLPVILSFVRPVLSQHRSGLV